MTQLTLNQGSNPNIDPIEVEQVYHYLRRSCERWAPYQRYITMTLHDHIVPAAEWNKNPLPDFAEAVKARTLRDYPTVKDFYDRNRSGWLKRITCTLFHRSRHTRETRTIMEKDFYFRDCNACSVVVEVKEAR